MKDVAVNYAEGVWDKKDLKTIDELTAENIVVHSVLGAFQGRQALKNVVQAWLTGFPDLKVENLAVIGEKDLVAIHWRANGTHRGVFKGIAPSGQPISYAGVTIYRIQDAKISEYWVYLDMQHLLKQIS